MLGADQRAVRARAAPFSGSLSGPSVQTSAGAAARPRRSARAVLLLGLLAASASSTAAGAVEWFVGGSLSQRLQAETNPDLEEDGEPIYGTTTALGLDVTALTPTTQWQFETGGSVGLFGGGDDENTDDRNKLNPNFGAAVSHNGKYVDTGASFAFDMQPSSFAQIEETGITEGDATQISIQLAADAAYALDSRNALSIGGSGRVIRFTGGSTTLDPNTFYSANLDWTHSISAITQGSLSFRVSRFTAESDENPESLTFDVLAGVSHLVNQRLSFDANFGVTATRTTETLLRGRETEFSLGAQGGLQAAWTPTPATQLVLALSHGLEPSSRGELQTTTALGLGLQHSVNSWTSAAVDLLVQRQSAGGGFENGSESEDRTFATLSPSLAFSLATDWALRASYALALEREDEGDAISNQFFLTLTHQFDILP